MCTGLALLTLSAATLGGCDQPNQMQVISVANRDIAPLEADDVVVTMRRAGFSDREILDLGPEVRNALASTGAAMIRTGDKAGDKVKAIFAVDGKFLHVSTRARGSFIYDLGKKVFL